MTDLHVDPYEVRFISIYSIFIYSFHKKSANSGGSATTWATN